MRPLLVIFDWDGTLIDSEAAIVPAMTEAYVQEHEEPPSYEAIRAIIGLSLADAVNRLTPALAADAVSRIVINYRRNYAARRTTPALFPGVRETLVSLKSIGYQLAVATGKSRAGLAQAIDETGLGDTFVTTRAADQTEPKPSPAMLHAILDDLGLGAAEALMIGDTEFDMAMARAAGMQPAGVSYGAHTVERLRSHDPAFVLNHFSELPSALTNL